jgi:type I restriction enzyme S subunit
MHHEHEIVRLGDVCEFVRGVTFRAAEAHDLPMPGFVPILRAGNIGDGLDLENDLLWVPSSRVRPEQYLQPGDIAVCLSSGSPRLVGKSAQLKEPFVGAVGAFCGIVRPAKSICGDYIAHWLRSPDFVEWRDSQARGVNIQNLRFSQFEKIRLPLPTLSEQKRIVAALEEQLVELDSARAAAKAQLEATQALPGALLREVFDGPEVKKWPIKTLKDTLEVAQLGFPCGARDPSGVVQLRMNNVTRDGKMQWDELLRVPRPRKMDSYLLHPGDVLFNNTNSVELVGKTAIFTGYSEPIVFSNHFTRLRVRRNVVLPEFLAFWLWLQWNEGLFAEGCNRWVGQAAFNRKKLLAVCIPLAPISEQNRIVEALKDQLAEVDRARAAVETQLDELALLPSKLLEKAFSGQI